jgi:proteasome lid subunit RPN8/RPN11
MTAPPDAIELPESLRRRMLDYALASPGEEVCGLIGGSGWRLRSWYPVPNAAPDRARRYLMSPEDQIDALRRIRDAGEELLGIFHSHPDAPAEPSAVDREMAAYPGVIYFIVSLQGDPDLQAWRFDDPGFSRLELR